MAQTVETLATCFIYRSLVLNRVEIDEERAKNPDDPIHRREDGSGSCRADIWHMCLCDQKSPFYNAEIIDGCMLILVPPAMVLDWKEDIEKFCRPVDKVLNRKPPPEANDLTFLIAHEEYGRGADKVEKHVNDLRGVLPDVELTVVDNNPMDPDLDYKWDEEKEAYVLAGSPRGQYCRVMPPENSSRFVIITTTQSYAGHVGKHLKSRPYTYYTGAKLRKANQTTPFAAVCPAFVIVDEAHLVRQMTAGHFALYRDIEGRLDYPLRSIWLTGTPFGKRPSDIIAMTSCMQINNQWTDEPLIRLSVAALSELDEKFVALEAEVKRGSIGQKEYTKAVDEMIAPLASAMPQICVRHTSESDWFFKRLKEEIPNSNADVEVVFPSQYQHALGIFTQTIKETLAKEKIQMMRKDKDAIIGEKRILSTARLFRIAASLPFLVQFWNKAENAKIQLTSKEMKEWIGKDGELVEECPLVPYVDDILSSSPKLEYVGKVLDNWDDEDGKLLVLSEFVVVAFFVALVSCLLARINIRSFGLCPPSVSIQLIFLQYIKRHYKQKSAICYHPALSAKERIPIKRGFQKYINLTAATKSLMYPDHDFDALTSTFRLMGTGVTLTEADKCILMEPQHMPPTEVQGWSRVLRISQRRFVHIVRLVSTDLPCERDVRNTGKLRAYLSAATMTSKS